MPSRRSWIAIVGLVSLLVLAAGVAAAGGPLRDKIREGQVITIGPDETLTHDVYAVASEVTVDGTIEGELVAAAGMVTVNGTVDGDIVVGAGRVEINGEVTGDVRVGSGDVVVTGTVGEDLVALAGQLNVTNGASVGEDLIFGAGNVVVDGNVTGNIRGTASTYARSGTVGGTEDVTLEGGAGEEPGEPAEPQPSEPVRIAGDGLVQWVTVVILGALGLLAVPGAVRASEGALRRRPLPSAGLGIGVIVGFLIQVIAVILLVILVAIAFSAAALEALGGIAVWVGLLDLMITTFVFVVSCAFIVDFVVGLSLARLVTRDWAQNRWQELALLAGGSFVVVLVTSLPGIGGIAKLVVIVMGLGAMAVAVMEWWQRRHPPVAPFTPAAAGLATASAAVPAPEAPAPPAPAAPAPPAPEAPATPAKPKRTRRTTAKPPTEPPPDSSAI